jgi:hypothetical protein
VTDILVVGFPKTGTSWLCRLLGDILDSPVGAIYKSASNKAVATEGQNRTGDYYIGQGHPVPGDVGNSLVPGGHLFLNLDYLQDEKIILITRDPRDVCVSAKHHWGMESIHQAIECVGEGKWPTPHGGGFCGFYQKWDGHIINIFRTSYEKLFNNPELELASIYYFITHYPVPTEKINQAISRQSFANRKRWTEQHGDTLNYGKEWQLRFLRKGVAGDWVNHFDERAIEMSKEYFGEWIGDKR